MSKIPEEVLNWVSKQDESSTYVDSTGQKWECIDRPITDDDPLVGRGKALADAAQAAIYLGVNQGVVINRMNIRRVND